MGKSWSYEHVSDTAICAAIYRAFETESTHAVFQDPFARLLAGERGEKIARILQKKHSWGWTTRAWLFDLLITEQIRQGADLVINLGAGLDARPYRMDLPASMTWVEVDFPGILDFKEEILIDQKSACVLQRSRMDVMDLSARRALLETFKTRPGNGMVISEGLLSYFSEDQVGVLARNLASVPALQYWIVDVVRPGLVEFIKKPPRGTVQFTPANGPEFFRPYGWVPVEAHSMFKTAADLRRLPFFLRWVTALPEKPTKMGVRTWPGVCLLKKQLPVN